MKYFVMSLSLFSILSAATLAKDEGDGSSNLGLKANLKCVNLIDGNYNGKSNAFAKSVDINITMDLRAQQALIEGILIAKANSQHEENDVVDLYSNFSENLKIDQKGDILRISSSWDTLMLNLRNGEGAFEQSYSNEKISGEIIYKTSIKFACTQMYFIKD
jgi:hypothetical protein